MTGIRRGSVRSSLAGLCAILCAGLAGCGMPAPGGQGVMRIGDDLVGAGGELQLANDVPGDVMVSGGSIRFTGAAGGDYLGAGGQLVIGGRIGGAVRAAGGQIQLTAEVGRNATIAGGEIVVGQESVIEGTAYLAGGSVQVDGIVHGGLRAGAGEVAIRGGIDGDVHIESGQLTIGPGATIGGDLTYRVEDGNVTIDPAARITGTTTALPPRPSSPFPGILTVIWLGGFLVAGAALVLIFPGLLAAAADAIRTRPAASAGMGILWIIAVPMAVAILAITLVGIPLAVIACGLYFASLYLARTVPALWLGRLLLRDRAGPGRGGAVLAFAVGAILLIIVGLIPYVGKIVTILATLFGLGAFALGLLGRRDRNHAAEPLTTEG